MTARRSESSSAVRDPGSSDPTWVLLDANALFLPVRSSIDLRRSIERWVERPRIAVPRSVLGELDRLVDEDVPDARAARALADRFPPVESTGRGDASVVDLALRLGAWVVTGDSALRGRLAARGLRVLFPRGRGSLAPDLSGRVRDRARKRL